MPDPSTDPTPLNDVGNDVVDADSVGEEVLTADVERERSELREFVTGLSPDQIRSGDWFARLLTHAVKTYAAKVDWQYFQDKYKGVPADSIVDQRIKMAARYAAIEGGLSAGAYTATVAATIGTAGGASPVAVPAAVTSVMVDVAYTTQIQLRLAYDVSVLYRVPVDTNDPDDLWKLIRVAFTIKSGEAASAGILKFVPLAVRPLVKKFLSGSTLTAARTLPVVGKHLLQRNVIKVGIPLVGVPLSVVLNRYTTQFAGEHARAVFRNEARIIETAEKLTKSSRHPQLMLWIAWLVILADGKRSDDETLLMRHLVRLAEEQHQIIDAHLANLVDLDLAEVWERIDAEPDDLSDILEAATKVAAIDGAINSRERKVIADIEERSRRS